MLNFLYTLFIAPIEFWMEKALDWGFDHTQSWGWAIIVMSLVVNTVILPIYLKAEHWQEEERAIRKSFEKDEAMIKRTFKGQERFAMLTTMHRLAGYSPLLTLRSSIGFFLQIPFFIAAYHFLSHFDPLQGVSFMGLADLSKPDEMFNLGGFAINFMPILMTIINIGSALIYTQNLSKRDKYQLYGMAAIFLVLLYNAASGLVLYWTFNNIYSLGKNFVLHDAKKMLSGISLPKFDLRNSVQKVVQKSKFTFNNISFNSIQKLFWPASILWLVLTFIYFPIELYNSDPEAFSITISEVFASLLGTCQIIIFILFLIWYFTRGRLRTFISYLTVVCVLSSLVFAFLWRPDVGSMDAFVLQYHETLQNSLNIYFDIGILCAVTILVVLLIQLNFIKIFNALFSISIISVLSLSLLTVMNLSSLNQGYSDAPTNVIPPETKKLLTFSENGQNIVILMLDTFTGGHIKQLLEKDPNLSKSLDGFTWYSDTISSGKMTIFGLPGILGGEQVAAFNLIDKNRTHALEDTINKSWADFLNYLSSKNYENSIHDYTWLNPGILNKHLNSEANLIKSNTIWNMLPKYWAANNHFKIENHTIKSPRFFLLYGLFKTSPHSLQKSIYNNGKWHGAIKSNYAQSRVLNWWAQLDSLPQFSQAENTIKNQFKFIVNETTHQPWSIGPNCLPNNSNVQPNKKDQNHDGIYRSHLQAEHCAIQSVVRWIEWMKKNHVYDNSLIFVLSDHGHWDSEQIYTLWKGKTDRVTFHSLLLVKPFDTHGPLSVNRHSLLTNYDVNLMIRHYLGESVEKPWTQKNRIRCSVTGDSNRTKHPKNYFIGKTMYCIKGNLGNKNGWSKTILEK